MPKKEIKDKEEITGGCKCPSCGASLNIVMGEPSPEEFAKEDEDGQRNDMEKDFKKRMGKLEEYG